MRHGASIVRFESGRGQSVSRRNTALDTWKSRIVGEGVEAAGQLLANPRNWRIHPKAQQDALAGYGKEYAKIVREYAAAQGITDAQARAQLTAQLTDGKKLAGLMDDLRAGVAPTWFDAWYVAAQGFAGRLDEIRADVASNAIEVRVELAKASVDLFKANLREELHGIGVGTEDAQAMMEKALPAARRSALSGLVPAQVSPASPALVPAPVVSVAGSPVTVAAANPAPVNVAAPNVNVAAVPAPPVNVAAPIFPTMKRDPLAGIQALLAPLFASLTPQGFGGMTPALAGAGIPGAFPAPMALPPITMPAVSMPPLSAPAASPSLGNLSITLVEQPDGSWSAQDIRGIAMDAATVVVERRERAAKGGVL
jgi:hypothetical protein